MLVFEGRVIEAVVIETEVNGFDGPYVREAKGIRVEVIDGVVTLVVEDENND